MASFKGSLRNTRLRPDLTDLVGFRIICYFTEQIDMISAIIEKLFDVDRDNCIDKSKTLSPNAFGYLSVHYICSLKKSDEYPEGALQVQVRDSDKNGAPAHMGGDRA